MTDAEIYRLACDISRVTNCGHHHTISVPTLYELLIQHKLLPEPRSMLAADLRLVLRREQRYIGQVSQDTMLRVIKDLES